MQCYFPNIRVDSKNLTESIFYKLLGGGSYPLSEEKYLMMRKNDEKIYAISNEAKDNFLLYTEMNVGQVK